MAPSSWECRQSQHRDREDHRTAVLVVLLGLGATYALLFALTLALGHGLFPRELIFRWAPGLPSDAGLEPLWALAGTISAFGLLIGSLGASLEGNDHFGHVIYADEET
jgi:hypothetical protein